MRTGGVIINADASQIYRDLPILSAAPSEEEKSSVDHRLFQVLDGSQACSAARWAMLAKAEIAAVHGQGRPAILVGGTGLYLRTLLDGIAPVPEIDAAIRAEVRDAPLETNREALTELDPQAAAKLKPADRQRIARALEVVRSTGRTLIQWQQEKVGGIGGNVDLNPLILLPPREWLYQRCDERFAAMIDQGAPSEVEALLARDLDPELPVMRAIGVAEIGAWLEGATDRKAMFAAGTLATRQYAKRQYTWFANQPPADWPRFTETLDGDDALRRALALLGIED